MVDVVLHLVGVGDVLCREHHAVALCRTAQQIVAGDIVIVCHPYHKIQAALPDAFFVVGKQGLRNAQILCRLFLGDAALLAQQLMIRLNSMMFGSSDKNRTSLIFGLQHVDYTQWKTTCKAKK